MKKLFSILAIAGLLAFNATTANAKELTPVSPEQISEIVAIDDAATAFIQDDAASDATEEASPSFHQVLKDKFIEGGAGFMGIVLLCLILGLAVAIERIIFLNMATTNTKKLAQQVEDALASGGVEAAKEVCRNTRGPVASIYYQGLD